VTLRADDGTSARVATDYEASPGLLPMLEAGAFLFGWWKPKALFGDVTP